MQGYQQISKQKVCEKRKKKTGKKVCKKCTNDLERKVWKKANNEICKIYARKEVIN